MYEGRILTSEYDAIDSILTEIRANHTEYALSPTSGVCRLGRAEPKHADYVRLVCACARECSANVDGLVRERKTRTQRANPEEETCPTVLNCVWDCNLHAWKVGKLVTEHRGHFARNVGNRRCQLSRGIVSGRVWLMHNCLRTRSVQRKRDSVASKRCQMT